MAKKNSPIPSRDSEVMSLLDTFLKDKCQTIDKDYSPDKVTAITFEGSDLVQNFFLNGKDYIMTIDWRLVQE